MGFGKRSVRVGEDSMKGQKELAGELDELWKWTHTDAQKLGKKEKDELPKEIAGERGSL